MLESLFPEVLRDFTRRALTGAITVCLSGQSDRKDIPGLLREIAETYSIEADLREEKSLTEPQNRLLAVWKMRGVSVLA